MIELHQQKPEHLNREQLKVFFGAYVQNTDSFEFTQGHRKLIKAVVKRINDTIAMSSDEQAGLALWNVQPKVHWWKNLCRTQWGLVYGDPADFEVSCDQTSNQSSKKRGQKKSTDLVKLSNTLFMKMDKVYASYNNKLKPMCEFSNDSISVKTIDGVSIEGIVTCIFCEIDSSARNVKVYFQQSSGRGSWITSNFTRHLTKHHGDNAKSEAIAKSSASFAHEHDRSIELVIEPALKTKDVVPTEQVLENRLP